MALIPAFGPSGVLPAFAGADPTVRAQVSPYLVSMTDFVSRFASSAERVAIAEGLIDYREALAAVGVTSGFQWIDGSFVEDCEGVRQRSPADVDVVTFAYRPATIMDNAQMKEFANKNVELFNPMMAKEKYKCDAYYIDLNKTSHLLVQDASYFNGLFSHQRDTGVWKGMLRIDLISDDPTARMML